MNILFRLFTIATATNSNKEIINEVNGLLINDTPESFSNGIEKILLTKHKLKVSK